MLEQLKNLEGIPAQIQMEKINKYLIGENGKEGKINNILAALKKKDAENIANGKPTKYFETFTRTVRDFSPDVARRIDVFVASYETNVPDDGKPASPLKRAIVQGGLPDGTNVEMNGTDEFVANLPDGMDITVEVDGDHITRTISL